MQRSKTLEAIAVVAFILVVDWLQRAGLWRSLMDWIFMLL